MNLKLLEKLVRLANNNPNENESNLAARRACKLIEAAKFNFTPDVVTIRPQQPYVPPENPRRANATHDYTYYDEYAKNPDLDFIFEFFRTRSEQQPKNEKPWTSPYPGADFGDIKVDFNSGFDFGRENPFTEFRGGQRAGKTQREKRPLNCHRCKKEYQTGFVGPPQMFTCNECHWAIYREEQEAKKANAK